MRVILRRLNKLIIKIGRSLKVKEKLPFLADIYTSTRGPKSIIIDILSIKCNHNCIMCWQRRLTEKERQISLKEDIENSLKLAEYKKMFDQLPFGVERIDVSGGGEPLLHPQIWKILELIKKFNFYGYLITNGTLLNKKNIKRLFKIKWDMVRISLHASNRKEYLKIHRKDDFEKVIKVIKMIKNFKKKFPNNFMNPSFLFVIQQANFDKIIDFWELSEKLGADEIEFDDCTPWVEKTLLNKKQIATAIKMLEKVNRFSRLTNNSAAVIKRYRNFYAEKTNNKDYIPFRKDKFYGRRCTIIGDSTLINCRGDVFPCCFLANSNYKMGNIRKESVMKIWKKQKYRKLRKDLINGRFKPECLQYCSYVE